MHGKSSLADEKNHQNPHTSKHLFVLKTSSLNIERDVNKKKTLRQDAQEQGRANGHQRHKLQNSDTCKEELGSLDDLKSIWERLKVLYVESTCGTWVKELNTMVKLIGGRKPGENPDEWMRKVITTARSIKDNLGDLNMDIFMAYILTVNLGDDLNHVSEAEGTTPVISTLEA